MFSESVTYEDTYISFSDDSDWLSLELSLFIPLDSHKNFRVADSANSQVLPQVYHKQSKHLELIVLRPYQL